MTFELMSQLNEKLDKNFLDWNFQFTAIKNPPLTPLDISDYSGSTSTWVVYE